MFPPGGPKPACIAPFFVRGSRRRGEPCLGSPRPTVVLYTYIHRKNIQSIMYKAAVFCVFVCLFVYGTLFLDGNKTHVAEVD